MRHVVHRVMHHVLQRHTTPGVAVVHRVLYHILMWCSVVYSAMYTTTCVSVVCSMWCNTVMLRGLQYVLHCCSTVCTAGCVAPCCTSTCLASHRVHHLLSFTKCILCTCTCTCILLGVAARVHARGDLQLLKRRQPTHRPLGALGSSYRRTRSGGGR